MSNLDLDDLIARIRREAAQREAAASDYPVRRILEHDAAARFETPLPRLSQSAEVVALDDLYRLERDDFLRAAYRTILEREPDGSGLANYGGYLDKGGKRLIVLARLLWSKEGRALARSPLHGLRWISRLRRVPGKRLMLPVLALLDRIYAARPPSHRAEIDALRAEFDGYTDSLEALLEQRDRRIGELERDLARAFDHADVLEGRLARLEPASDDLATRLAGIGASQAETLERLNAIDAEIDARLARIDERLGGEKARIDALDAARSVNDAWQVEQKARVDAAVGRADALEPRLANSEVRLDALEPGLAETGARLEELNRRLGALSHATERIETEQQSLRPRTERLDEQLKRLDRDFDLSRSDLIYHRTLLERARIELRERLVQADALPAASDDALDAYYAAFEDRFRGDKGDIQGAMRHYLEDVHAAQSVDERHPLLDLGCGRGEWLQLLADAGIPARGIDTNRIMVAHCIERALAVVREDALVHLRALQDASIGAISAFHLIEHLPFPTLYALLHEAQRVLRPGGLLLLETPNPENVLVGSHTFYHDPTHRNPLTPVSSVFLVRYCGFGEPRIKRLHPYPEAAKVPGDDPLTERVNGHLCGPQDYAILAIKPMAGA